MLFLTYNNLKRIQVVPEWKQVAFLCGMMHQIELGRITEGWHYNFNDTFLVRRLTLSCGAVKNFNCHFPRASGRIFNLRELFLFTTTLNSSPRKYFRLSFTSTRYLKLQRIYLKRALGLALCGKIKVWWEDTGANSL